MAYFHPFDDVCQRLRIVFVFELDSYVRASLRAEFREASAVILKAKSFHFLRRVICMRN